MSDNTSQRPRRLIALYLDFANPKSEQLKQGLELFVQSLKQQGQPSNLPIEGCVSLLAAGDFEKALATCEPIFILIDYKRALEEPLDLGRLSELRQQALVVLIVPEYFSNETFQSLSNEGRLAYDFVSRSRFWESELLLFVSLMARHRQAQVEAHILKRQVDGCSEKVSLLEQQLQAKSKSVRELEHTVANSIMFDAKTGLETNHAFLVRFRSALEEASRHSDNVALLYMGIGNHKQISEAYGPEGSGFVVVEIANWVRKMLRASDAASYDEGSSTYWVMLKRIHPKSVLNTCYRFKRSLENRTFFYRGQYKLQVSLSMGVSSTINYRRNTFDVGDMIERAVIALRNASRKDPYQNVVFYA